MLRISFTTYGRQELGAGIFTNLDRIDVIEAIAEDYWDSCLLAQLDLARRALETGRAARLAA